MNIATSILVLAGLLSTVTAGPLSQKETQCATTCTDDSNKFGYETGRTYIYSYEAKANTKVPGTTSQESELYVRTRVKIDVLSKCNLVLRLLDVSLENASPTDNWRRTAPPNARQFNEALQANPLPFAFQDGRVDHICPSEDEPAWVLNIKRGILSVLQNTMETFEKDKIVQETDVSGTCDADYKVAERGWSSTTIKKTKNLLACQNRHAHQSALQSLPYESSSPTQSLPILKSIHECTHTIKSKRIDSAKCEEQHVFRPFSNGNAGVTTSITQVLTYESEETVRYRQSGSSFVRSSLLFDHKYKDSSHKNDKDEAEQALSHLCYAAQDDIRPDVPAFFSKLVRKLRELQRNQLQDIFNNLDTICNGNPKSRKFFLDGLQMAFSADSMELIVDLITQNEISDMEADVWLLSTAFVPNPTKSMIKSLTKLIEVPSPKQKAVLGLSAMVHTYCQQHECETDSELQSVLKKFLGKLDRNCNVQEDEDQTNMLVFLKAIGNMGFGKTAIPLLERCYKEKENPVEVRIAAIEALRRMPCGTKYSDMLHIFADGQEDTEVRIAAYMLLMKCPTRENIHTIKDLLHKEELNQVYSFVWTHLTNIQESVDPCKHDIRELLRDQVLKRKFSTDSRKFSRAFEGSLYSEAMNTGVHTEGSLIFSQKSFLPRSASFNLTVDLFGSSMNLFEIGGRAEGFEHLVESFFGPNGYYPEKSINKILRSIRGKRSIDDNKLIGMEQKFRARSQFGDHPKGSMFLRVFGNDLHYATFDGLKNRDGTGFYDLFENVLKQEEVDLTKSFTFLDSSLITPTAMGLPLNLTLNGTAVVNIQMKGHLDLDKIANMDCDVTGYMKPSAAVQVTGTMAMDAFILQTGLKVKATLHTSTAVSGKVQLRRGELVSIQMDAPKEKMEIININTEVLLLTGDNEISPEGRTKNMVDVKHCSGRMTTRPLGFEVCAELKYPSTDPSEDVPNFPFSGPAAASIYWEKTDPTLSHYAFEYRWQNEKKGYSDQYVRTRRLSFNTPGSSMDREFTAEVIISEPEHSIRAALRTPLKKIGITGKYSNDPDLKKIDGSFSIDDEEKGVIQAALQMEQNQGVVRFVPSLYIRASRVALVSLKGYTTIQRGKKIGVDLTLEHLTVKPIVIQGEIARTHQAGGNRFEVNTKLKSHLLTGSVKGHVLLGEKQDTSALSVEYSIEDRPKKQYDITSKYRDNSSRSGLKHSANVEIQGTDMKALMFDWDLHTSDNKLEYVLELSRGSGHEMKKMTLRQTLLRENDGHAKKMMAMMRASCPACGIEWGLDANHQHNDSALTSRITVEHGKGQKASVQLDAYKTLTVLLNVGTSLNFNYPGHDAKFSANLKQPSSDEIYGSVNADMPGKKLAARASYRNKKNDQDGPGHEVDAEFQFPSMEPIVVKGDIRGGKHPSASAAYEHENNRYAVAADYDTTSGVDHKLKALLALPKIRYDAHGSLSVQPHESRFIADLHINKKQQIHFEAKTDRKTDAVSGSVDLKWGGNNHSNKRAFISFDIKKPDLGYELSAVVRCPVHSTRFEFLTKTEGKPSSPSFTHVTKGELQWNQNKIAASLDVNQVRRGSRTELYLEAGLDIPQVGLDKPSLSYSHTLQDNEFNFEAKLQHLNAVYILTADNRIKLFPSFDSAVKLVLPNAEPIQFTVNFQMSDRKCTAKIHSKKFEVLVSGDNKSSRNNCHYTGTVMIKTGDLYRFSSEYKREDRKISAMISTEHNSKTCSVIIEGESNSDESKTDLIATVNLNHQMTRDSTMTTSKLVARYSNDGSNLSSMLETTMNSADRFAIEVVGSKHTDNRKINVAGSIHVVSTFGPLKDVLLMGSHECGNGKASSSIEIKWDEEKAIALKVDVAPISMNNFKLNVLFTTPYDILDRLSLDIHHSITDKLETTMEAAYNENTVSFEVKGRVVSSSSKKSVTGTGILRTSSKRFPELQASFAHTRSQGEFSNRIQLTWGQSTASLIHTGMYKDWLNFQNSVTIKTPYNGFEVVAADARQLYSNRGFTHQSSFDMGSNSKYQLTIDSRGKEQSNGFKQQLQVSVISPKKTYGPYQVEVAWKKENGESIASGAFEMPSGQRVEVSGNTSVGKTFGKGTMKMMTPFAGWDNVILSGMYDANDVPTKVSLSLQWSPEHRVELESNAKFTDREGSVQVNIATPFKQFRKISLGGQFTYDFHHQNHKIFLSVNDRKYEAELVASLDNDFRVLTSLTVQTPIRGWERLHAEYCFQMSKGYAHVAVEKNEEQIKVIVAVMLRKTGEIGLQLYTPFRDYQVMKAVLNYENKKHLKLLLQKENISAVFNINVEFQPEKVAFLSKLESAHFNLNTGVEGTWYNDGPKTSLKAVVNYNADRIIIESSVMVPDGNPMATLLVKTPFRGFEKFEGTFKVERGREENVVTAILDINEDKNELVALWAIFPENSHASLSVVSPFLEDFLLSAQYDVSTPAKTAALVLSYGTNSAKLSANIAREYSRIEGSAEVKLTSQDGDSEYSISFNEDFEASPQYVALHLKANKHFLKIMGTGEMKDSHQPRKGHLNVVVDGSIFKQNNNGFEVTYDFGDRKSINIVGTIENRKFELNAKDEGIKMTVSFTADFSPFENYQTTSIDAVYNSQERENNIDITMKNDDEITKLSGNLIMKNGKQELKLSSDSPHNFLKAMELVAGFNIDGPEKSIVLTAKNEEKNVDIRGVMRYDDNKSTAALYLTSSEPGYESVVAQAVFDVSQPIKKIQFTMQNGDERSEATIIASRAHHQGELSLTLRTPYRNYEDIFFSAHYNIAKEKTATITYHWRQDKEVKLALRLVHKPMTVDARLTVTTPFRHYEKTDIAMRFNFMGSEKNVEFSIERSKKKSVEFVLNLHKERDSAQVTVKLVTPVKQFAHYDLTADYDISQPEISANVAFVWTNEIWKEARITYRGNVGVQNVVHLVLEPAKQDNDLVEFRLNHDFSSAEKKVKIIGTIYGETIKLTSDINTDQMTMKIAFRSPYSGYEFITLVGEIPFLPRGRTGKLIGKWNDQEMNADFVCKDSNCLTDNDVKFSLNSQMQNLEEVRANLKYNFVSMEKYELQLTAKKNDNWLKFVHNSQFLRDKVDIEFKFTSTIPQVSILAARLGLEFFKYKSSAIATLQYSEDKTVELSADIDFRKDLTIAAKMTTPIQKYELTELTIQYTTEGRKITGSIVGTKDRDRIELKGYIQTEREHGDMKIMLNTPFTKPSSIVGNYDLNKKDQNAFLNLQFGEERVEIKGTLHIDDIKSTAKFEIATPYENMKTINLDLELSRNQPKKHLEVTLNLPNDNQIQVNGDFELRSFKYLSGNFTLKTPINSLKFVEIKSLYTNEREELGGLFAARWSNENHVKLAGFLKQNKILFTFDSPQESVKLSGSVDNKHGMFRSHGILERRGEIIVSFNTELKHKFPTMFDGSAKLATAWKEFSEMSITGRYQFDDDGFQSQLDVVTPFESTKSIHSECVYHHKGKMNDDAFFVFELPDERLYISLTHKSSHLSYNVGMKVESSFDFISNADFKLESKFTDQKTFYVPTSVDISLTLPEEKHEFSYQLDISKNKLSGQLNINCPWISDRTISSQITGTYDKQRAQFSGSADIPSGTHTVNGDLQYNDQTIKGTIKMNDKLKINLDCDIPRKEFRATVTENRKTHHVSGRFQNMHDGMQVDITVDTPLMNIKSILLKHDLRSDSMHGVISITTTSASHNMEFSAKWNDAATSWHATVETPLYDIEYANLEGKLTSNGNKRQVETTLKTASSSHSISGAVNAEGNIVTAQVSIETPILNINTWTISLRVSNSRMKNISAEISLITSTTVHSLSAVIINKDNMFQSQMKLKTPLFNINSIGLNGMYQHEREKAELNLGIKLPDSSHSVSTTVYHSPAAINVEFNLETPVFNIKTITASIKVPKKLDRDFEANVAVEMSDKRHTFEMDLLKNKDVLETNLRIQTPAFKIGFIGFNGKIIHQGWLNTEIMASLETRQSKQSFSLSFQKYSTSMVGQLKLDLPAMNIQGFQITLKISPSGEKGHFTEMIVTTEKHQHKAQVGLSRMADKMDGSLLFDSPLTEPIKIIINGAGRCSSACSFSAEITSGKNIVQINGNYKTDSSGIESSINIDTPFKHLENIKGTMYYKYGRSHSIRAGAEFRTSNTKFDLFSIQATLQPKHSDQEEYEITVNAQTPFAAIKTVKVEGNFGFKLVRDIAEVATQLTVTIPKGKYDFAGQLSKSWDQLSVDTELQWNTKKAEFGIGITYATAGNYEGYFKLGTPFIETITVEWKANTGRNSRNWQGSLERGSDRYSVNLDHSPEKGRLDVTSPFYGHESTSVAYQKTRHDNNGKKYVIEIKQGRKTKASLSVQVKPEEVRIEVVSPIRGYEVLVMYFGSKDNSYKTGISLNDKSLLEVKYQMKEGRHVIQVTTLDHPMMATYIRHQTDDGWIAEGEFSYNTNERSESTYGLSMQKKRLDGGYNMVINAKDGRRTMTLSALTQKLPSSYHHKTEFMWDQENARGLAYEIKIKDGSTYDKIQNDVTAALRYLSQTYELKIQNEKTQRDLLSAADFKWGTDQNNDKHVGARIEYHDLSRGRALRQKALFTLTHHKLEKDLVLRGEMASYSGQELFLLKTDMEYSRNQNENLKFEVKLKEDARNHYKAEVTLKHPKSNLDLHLKTDLSLSSRETSVRVNFKYMDRTGKQHDVEIQAKAIKHDKDIELQIEFPDLSLNMKGNMELSEEQSVLNLQGTINEELPITAKIQIDRTLPNILMEVLYSPRDQKSFSMSAGMPNHKLVKLEINHEENGEQKIQDVLFILQLNNSRVLDARASWQMPNIFDAINIIADKYSTSKQNWYSTSKEASSFVEEEIKDKVERISSSMATHLRPLLEDFESFASKLERVRNFLDETSKKMYRENRLYSKNILDAFKHICSELNFDFSRYLDYISDTLHQLKLSVKRMPQMLVDIIPNYLDYIDTKLQDWRTSVHRWTQDSSEAVRSIHRNVANAVIDVLCHLHDKVRPLVQHLTPAVKRFIERVCDRVQNLIDATAEYMADLMVKGKEIPGVTYASDMVADLVPDDAAMETLNKYYKTVKDKYSKTVEDGAETYKRWATSPQVEYVTDVAKDTYDKATWAYDYWNVEENVKTAATRLYSHTRDFLLDLVHDLAIKYPYVSIDASHVTEFNPDMGHFRHTQQLPVDWNNFKELPDLSRSAQFTTVMDWKDKALDQLNKFSFWDTYNKHKPKFSLGQILPPFDAYAMLAGKQHYMTFDKRFFEFSGKCSYLLAHDFVDRNFTAIVNYEGKDGSVTKKSLFLMFRDNKIEIDTDLTVTVNKKKTELPIQLDDITVTREGSAVIVHTEKGVQVTCNFGIDVCVVRMSGWYFGKTGGMFGTYDNEPRNDFVTPDRKEVDDVAEFASSWEIGATSCKTNSNLAVQSNKAAKVCTDLFKSSESPLRSCFYKVIPDDFYTMCSNDVSSYSSSSDSSRTEDLACTSVAAYVTQCKLEGATIKMPDSCVKCTLPNKGVFKAGQDITLKEDTIPRSADVVFIVEEKMCNKNIKLLQELVKGVEAGLQTQNIDRNHYALIGFGGDGVHDAPHIHTANGKIFTNERDIVNLAFSTIQTGHGNIDLLAAIRKAAQLPYRAGVSKNVLVLPCSDAMHYSTAEYDIVHHMLKKQHIKLHVFAPSGFDMKGSSGTRNKDVIGIDNDAAYTLKDVKDRELEGDSDLRTQVSVPTTLPVSLALHSNGSVFSRPPTNAKPKVVKMALEVFVRRVALTTSPPTCQKCHCVPDKFGEGQAFCVPCDPYGQKQNTPENQDIYKQLRGYTERAIQRGFAKVKSEIN